MKKYNRLFKTNGIYTKECIYREFIDSFVYIRKNIYGENYLLEHI